MEENSIVPFLIPIVVVPLAFGLNLAIRKCNFSKRPEEERDYILGIFQDPLPRAEKFKNG